MRGKARRLIPALVMILGLLLVACQGDQMTSAVPGEVEATSYEGISLTPLQKQGNNAIKGTQYLDRNTYQLKIEGLVAKPLLLSYTDILAYPAVSRVIDLNCVEGWGFTAKWTGVPLKTWFSEAGLNKGARTVTFHCADGYSTSLPLDYVLEKDVLAAYKINDLTLPPDRGFPFQMVAEGKYGYKWAKWVTRIEVSDQDYRGFWESRGYSNQADYGGPAFE